jgi:choline kinase
MDGSMHEDVTWLCLAAGKGSRLRPITDDRPKAMVSVADRPLVDWLTDTARQVGIKDLVVVTGYRGEMIKTHLDGDVRTFENPVYDSTDMVHSLWRAEAALEGPVVVSYSDILYTPAVLKRLLNSSHDVAVAVDKDWRSYWERRHEDPLEDAESLVLDAEGRITSVGQPVDSMQEPEGQYVGLIAFSEVGLEQFREAYNNAQASAERTIGADGRSFDTLHMTDLLQRVIDRDGDVHAEYIAGDWVEIDTSRDLELARSVCHSAGDGTLTIDRTQVDSEVDQ